MKLKRMLEQMKVSNSASNLSNIKQVNYFTHIQQGTQKLTDLLLENNLFYRDSFKLIELMSKLSPNSLNEPWQMQQSNISRIAELVQKHYLEQLETEKTLQKKISLQLEEIVGLKNQLEGCNKQIDTSEELNELRNKFTSASGQVERLQQEIQQMSLKSQSEKSNWDKQLVELKSKQSTEIDELKKQLNEVLGQKSELERKAEQMNKEKEREAAEKMRRISQQSQVDIEKFKLQKQQLELEHESIKEDYQKLWAANQLQTQKFNEMKANLECADKEKLSLQMQLKESQSSVDTKNAEICEYQRVLEVWQKNDQDLRKEIESLKEQTFALEYVSAQNKQLEDLIASYKQEIETQSCQRYEQKNGYLQDLQKEKEKIAELEGVICQLQIQLAKGEEQLLTKEDVASSSSDNSHLAEYEEQIKLLTSQVEELTKENQELKVKLRQTSKMNRSSTTIQPSKQASSNAPFYWDLEIVGCNNGLLSLVNDKWVMNFRNTDQQATDYIGSVSIFSFEHAALTALVSLLFNNSESLQCAFEHETTYLKVINRKMHLNLSPKKSFGKILVPKPYLLLARLLNEYEMHSSSEVGGNYFNETALNEFWLKYGLSQNGGIVIFTCTTLTFQAMHFIRYLNSQITSMGNKIVPYFLIIVGSLVSQYEEELPLLDIRPPSEDLDQPKYILSLQENDLDKRKFIDDLIMNNQKTIKQAANVIESLREFMINNMTHFFEINPNEIAPDFDMQQVGREDRWLFRLLLNKNENYTYALNPNRNTLFYLQDKVTAYLQEKETEFLLTIELEQSTQIIDVQIILAPLPDKGSKLLVTIETLHNQLKVTRSLVQYMPSTQEELTKSFQDNKAQITFRK